MALQWGWTRVGLLGDVNDAYSTSVFDLLNGTDPSNPSNLQPPLNADDQGGSYDATRLEIAHAALVDGQDTNTTKDALVAAIKVKDVKVIMLFGQTAFVEGIVLYGLDRGIFGDGYQIMLFDAQTVSKMNQRCHATMDGAVLIAATGTSPEYPGFVRSAAFWSRHPPTQIPLAAATNTPFMVRARMNGCESEQ